jgi:hypothetical protein
MNDKMTTEKLPKRYSKDNSMKDIAFLISLINIRQVNNNNPEAIQRPMAIYRKS